MAVDTAAPFVNIAAYKFVRLDNLSERRGSLRNRCQQLQLKGTILLSQEGINLFLAGTPSHIATFVQELRSQREFADLEIKESPSDHQPFSRMLVRLKKEIITLGVPGIDPVNHPSPKLPPQELREWIRQGRKFHFLDTRNTYEVELGTFADAHILNIDSFREFPEAIRQLPESWKSEPIVMFCTGGIRCEKAGPLMEREGFQQIYQLEGGILRYFEECAGEGYNGDCFVFDKRVAVNPALRETEAGLCYACQAVLSAADQTHPHYQPPDSCPHCYRTEAERMAERLQQRQLRLREITQVLPGSVPYDNLRPLNVAERFDRLTVGAFLTQLHPHLAGEYWQAECEAGRLRYQDRALEWSETVRSGWRILHLIPQTVEPDVNANIELIYEDSGLVGVNKPAPLPMHPCGRFNRNTLIGILDQVYKPHCLRMLHRLDANTTGTVVLARTKEVAQQIHPLFARGKVGKRYLALVHGVPEQDEFQCELPLSRQPRSAGGRFADLEAGLPATTKFRVLNRQENRALVECLPVTGRTNQIRLHLASLGFPIVGDPLYRQTSDAWQSPAPESSDPESPSDDQTTATLDVHAPPLCLHSWELSFQHPLRDQLVNLISPPPAWADFADLR